MLLKKIIWGLLILIVVLASLTLIMRNTLLNWSFEQMQQKVNKRNASLTVSDISFKSFRTIRVKQLCLIPHHADTLLFVKQADVKISWLTLIKLKPVLSEVVLDSLLITIYQQPERNNTSFLKNKTEKQSQNVSIGYSTKVAALADNVFKVLDIKTKVNYLSVFYADSSQTETIIVPMFQNDLKNINTTILFKKNNVFDTLFVSASAIQKGKSYAFSFNHPAGGKLYFPFINNSNLPKTAFKTFTGKIEYNYNSRVTLDIETEINDLYINHWRLAESDVIMPKTSFRGTINIGANDWQIDSTSSIELNNAKATLFVYYNNLQKKAYALKIKSEPTHADTFFNALPLGMFKTLRGIKANGTLSFNLDFELNGLKPDDVKFDASLKKKNFSIISYGAEYYGRINQTFIFDALDGDRIVRQLTVGPENSMFTAYSEIPDFLKYAVLTSEDGSFMYHRGFNEEAFRQSIATNYKQGRFARGGSTITMQLVKNCFLSRDKTVSRKAEEALIVWLIENCGIVSKERMLEVYLNVIEWGPDVYGIGEASGFYFGKTPKELTLAESIFLASIVPHPKYFKYSFNSDATLKPFLASYYRLLSNKMLGRNWITATDTVGLTANVHLLGPAKNYVLLPNDTLPMPSDSLLQQDLILPD
jgi:hypothetical protein